MTNVCVASTVFPQVIPRGNLIGFLLLLGPIAVRPPDLPSRWPPQKAKYNCSDPDKLNIRRIPVVNGLKREYSALHICFEGDVLSEGYKQGVALGRAYRRYLERTHILGKSYKPERIRLISSDSDASVQTLALVVQGLYPPTREGQRLKIDFADGGERVLAPGFDTDEEFIRWFATQLKTDRGRTSFNSTKDRLNGGFPGRAGPKRFAVKRLNAGNRYLPYYCNNGASLAGGRKDVIENLLANSGQLERFYAEFARDNASKLINDFVANEILAHRQTGNRPRLTIASAENIALVLFVLGLNDTALKLSLPAASHLAIEVWDDGTKYVRVVLNGQVVPIEGQEQIELELFQALLKSRDSDEVRFARLALEVKALKAKLEEVKEGGRNSPRREKRAKSDEKGKSKSSDSGGAGSRKSAGRGKSSGGDGSASGK